MVYGVDASEAIIAEARHRTRELDVPLQFQVCDAHGLTFKDASFDVCRAERVLLYLENPAMVITEMARVTRPGGHVIVFDFNYGTRFIDSDFAPMTRPIEALLASDAVARAGSDGAGRKVLPRATRLHRSGVESLVHVGFGSRAAIPTTLVASPVYPRLLMTLLYRPSRQPWANNGRSATWLQRSLDRRNACKSTVPLLRAKFLMVVHRQLRQLISRSR
jgi:SAM-dependent methyltransferase